MKIMIIEPDVLSPEEMKRQESYIRSICSQDTSFTQSRVDPAYPLPKDFSQFSLYVPDILRSVKKAENEKFNAVCIDCFTDMGLESAKIAANIPVIGPCEASLHFALLLADKIGLITPMDEGIPFHFRQIRSYGFIDRVISIRAINIPLAKFYSAKDESENKLVGVAREMMKEGAQLIIVGCNGIFPTLGIGSARRFSERLGVPVIDPTATMVKTAEILVDLNLCQSNLAFPKTAQLF